MIQFVKQPIGSLNVATGEVNGIGTNSGSATNIGIPVPDFHRYVTDLAQKKVPLEETLSAIDKYPAITDKTKAKSMATAIYSILDTGKK